MSDSRSRLTTPREDAPICGDPGYWFIKALIMVVRDVIREFGVWVGIADDSGG